METDSRILLGSQELFYRYGIRSVTMDDIAKHLAISKKTIYRHFGDKNELVMELTEMDIVAHRNKFDHVAKDSKHAIDEMFRMMQDMSEMFGKMNVNLFYDLQKYHPKAWDRFRDFKNKSILKMVETNLIRGIEEGLYRKALNVKVMARMRIEVVEMAFNPQIFPPSKNSISIVQMAMLEHFLYGIISQKGYGVLNKLMTKK